MRILLIFLLAMMTSAGAYAAASIKPTETLNLEVRKGELIKLPRAAASVMIADPAIADIEVKSPTMLYIYGKAVGQTTVFALDDKEGGILGATVKVSHNVSSLNEAVKSMLPDAKVSFRSIDGGMVMEGKVSSPVDAADLQRVVGAYMQQSERLINMVQVAGANQVTLRVRVAEVSRSELKNFGINLQAVLNPSNLAFGLATGRPFVEGLLGRLATSNTIVGTTQVGNLDVNSMIDILEDQGLVTTLAEPSLTAITGQTARFLAGGQYPIPVMGQNNTVTIQY
ncbi:MAG: pilus assembly protein N-terminal domain-containing protein, partial [Alphaproteobacteria bacterium]|nr:pilus assembly protein N-terminal domain-containing protein [Alphaproteobacteria bacterium]